jgi:type IV pilus assembly protein PilO
MAKLSDMSQQVQLAVVFGVLAVLTGGLYFGLYKNMADANHDMGLKLEAKQAENDKLRPYEANLPELNRITEAFRMQLENLQRIVPDEKDADQFMHAMQDEARKANVQVRSYVAKQTAQHEFYTEVPFDIQLDGQYSALLSFFDHVGNLDRIVNISDLKLYGIKGSEKGGGKSYTYAPNETVVALCQASTFFSHDANKAPGKDVKKKK